MSDADRQRVRYLAPAQVAELLTISVDEVLALVQEGRLGGARLGTPPRWRIEESSVGAYVDDQVEEARRMRLWEQSQDASVAEMFAPQRAPEKRPRG